MTPCQDGGGLLAMKGEGGESLLSNLDQRWCACHGMLWVHIPGPRNLEIRLAGSTRVLQPAGRQY